MEPSLTAQGLSRKKLWCISYLFWDKWENSVSKLAIQTIAFVPTYITYSQLSELSWVIFACSPFRDKFDLSVVALIILFVIFFVHNRVNVSNYHNLVRVVLALHYYCLHRKLHYWTNLGVQQYAVSFLFTIKFSILSPIYKSNKKLVKSFIYCKKKLYRNLF